MNYAEESLKKHYEWKGKIEVTQRVDVKTKEDLSLAYTPGVATPCLEIQKDESTNVLQAIPFRQGTPSKGNHAEAACGLSL